MQDATNKKCFQLQLNYLKQALKNTPYYIIYTDDLGPQFHADLYKSPNLYLGEIARDKHPDRPHAVPKWRVVIGQTGFVGDVIGAAGFLKRKLALEPAA